MSAKGIQQISSVHGFCTAGGATFLQWGQALLSKARNNLSRRPPLVKAATGEDVTAEELGGAKVHLY